MAGRIAASLMVLATIPAPLAAQAQGQSAEDMVETAREAYGPAPPRPRCDPNSEDPTVIVVCAELEEQGQFRVRTDEEAENEYARDTMNRGRPAPPNVDGPGIFQGPATFKLAPPVPPLIIDLEEIPDAPEGSDADLIGKGERGS
jgi:hypothetical protein